MKRERLAEVDFDVNPFCQFVRTIMSSLNRIGSHWFRSSDMPTRKIGPRVWFGWPTPSGPGIEVQENPTGVRRERLWLLTP